MIENDEFVSSETNSYYWLSYDGLKTIIPMKPYDHLEPEQERIDKNRHFLIDNKQWLYEHGGLHPIIPRKVEYIPVNVYNHMKEIFIKNWNLRVRWD